MLAVNLKDIHWKRHANTVFKVFLDTKVIGLIALNGLTFYGIGWDTILKPNIEAMKSRDEAIAEQKKVLTEKEALQQQYGTWEKQLKDLDAKMVPVFEGNSAKVISVSEAADLLDLAQGKKRDSAVLPPLEPPHDMRENVTLTPVSNSIVDILKTDEAQPAQGEAPANPALPPEVSAVSAGPEGAHPPGEMAGPVDGGAATSIPVEKFDYELKVTGTYPALVDLLNELVIRKTLVKINKITITKPPASMAEQPDAKEYPDFPLKLEMTVSLSIFLYSSNEPQPS